MLELSWHNAIFRQSVAEVAARERAFGTFFTVDHQMIQIKHLPCTRIVPVVFGTIFEVVVIDDNVVSC